MMTNFFFGHVEYWNFFYVFIIGFASIWLGDIYDLSLKLMVTEIDFGIDQIE